MTQAVDHEALIVGTGFGGMGAAIALKRAGIGSIMMLERESDLGGTWQINHYPGLAVDIPSVSYSYSFEPNPNWSRAYAPGAEIRAYAHHIADKYDLRRHMRFNTTVVRAHFNDTDQIWSVETDQGETIRARMLLLATGFLSQPRYPDIDGVHDFAGKVVHTADWDHDYDYSGKRMAIIGTGASAVQVIPEMSKIADNLTVYQRTPIWVSPRANPKISQRTKNLYARFPLTQRLARLTMSSLFETLMVTAILHARQTKFFVRMAERACLAYMHKQIADPELRRKLTPNYNYGCKRPAFSTDYYRSFTRDNVDLVTDPIDHIEADGIVTQDGTKKPIDTLILATGFNVWQKGNFPAFDVFGKQGVELGDWWSKNRYQSYEGITVPGFPNLFNLHSPFSYNGFSYFSTIEVQMAHMQRCLKEMKKRGAHSFEVTDQAKDRFMSVMQKRQADTIFLTGDCGSANSYYFNPHGEPTLLRLSTVSTAMRHAKRFPLSDYRFA